MKALILNSGIGSRMGEITKSKPKCMTEISNNETIISRQLVLLKECGIKDIVITTGYLNNVLEEYCNNLNLNLNITYVYNPLYRETNSIYSIYCAKDYLHDDIIMMHGDLVFSLNVIKKIIMDTKSHMVVSSTVPLPEKDFKAAINNHIKKISVSDFTNALTAQPLYKIKKEDWEIWLNSIIDFCENNNVNCYAENAFNEVSEKCLIYPLDVKNELCGEIDNPEDLKVISNKIQKLGGKK